MIAPCLTMLIILARTGWFETASFETTKYNTTAYF
jgi:hypothetical protein